MPRQTIVVLDDDPDLCQFFSTTLESIGFTVITASNSEHVVELVAHHRAILLITDLVMPDHEGMEGIFSVLRTFRIPIIAVSSYRDYLKVVEPIAHAVLVKPIQAQTLIDTVKRVLGISPSASPQLN
ncbi:MAG: response regulator [Burkholderiales bacterium]|nr:response regulator [Burkholderiales bacterium]